MARDTNGITPELRRQAIDRLFAERCSCVIRNGSDMRVFYERGVKDLYRLLKEEPGLLRGAFVADKVVGKAAAALLARRGICGCDQPAGPRFAGEKRGRHRLQALRAAYRQPYAYRPVSVGNPLRRIANARRVPGTGNGFYRDDETGGIGAAGAFRLLSGMRVICSTLYKETAPGYFRPERESVRFGIFSSFFAGSCWNKADCFRIFV